MSECDRVKRDQDDEEREELVNKFAFQAHSKENLSKGNSLEMTQTYSKLQA